jgi:hypothetical protein
MNSRSLLAALAAKTAELERDTRKTNQTFGGSRTNGVYPQSRGLTLADVVHHGASLSKEDSSALVDEYLGNSGLSANDPRNPNVLSQYREESDNSARRQLGLGPMPNGKNNLQILQDAADRAKRTGDYNALALDVMAVNPTLAQNLLTMVDTKGYREDQQKNDLEKYKMMYGDDSNKNIFIDSERGLIGDKRTGQARQITVDGHPVGAKKGKPSTDDVKVTDAKEVLGLLNMAEPLINESTGSLIGAGVDAAAGAFGHGTDGAKAASRLKAIEGLLVSKMPRMQGPQSDKDVMLYKQMAGQIGDSTVPASVKAEALDTIREINSRYAGGENQPLAGQANSFESLPDPRQYAGKTVRDDESGVRMRSNGSAWVRVQ